MIIIVSTREGKIITRPETSWERNGTDFYPQEFIEAVACVPVVYARISKSGRSVVGKFAKRYYDCFGYGLLLYPENLLDGSPESIACASCIDHSSYLAGPLFDREEASGPGKRFILKKDGGTVFEFGEAVEGMIEEALAEATARIHVRTGDLLAIELSAPLHLCSRPCNTRIEGGIADELPYDFNIIMNLL